MEGKQENEKGIYIKEETLKQTPEDGFVRDSEMEPANMDSRKDNQESFHKGYRTTKTYTTNDPKVTRPFAYGVCGICFIIGIVLLLCGDWIMGLPFVILSVVGFIQAKKEIDKVAEDLKAKGQDVTIDSKEELEEVVKGVADTIKEGWEETEKETFTKKSYDWFLKATLPIYIIVACIITVLIAIFVNIILALILAVVLVLVGVLYYKIVKKICGY